MKRLLPLSLLLNLGLGGSLVYIFASGPQLIHPDAPISASINTEAPAITPKPPSLTEVKPFRWNQLESADYQVYVANLRSIGCPKQTVADIIRADVHSVYEAHRRQLRLNETNAGAWSRTEESQLVATLLGSEPKNQNILSEPTLTAQAEPIIRTEGNPADSKSSTTAIITVPLVMQDLDLDAAGLDEGQKKAVEELRQRFLDAAGSQNHPGTISANNPGSDAVSATPNSENTDGQDSSNNNPSAGANSAAKEEVLTEDDILRGMIGQSAWMALQLQGKTPNTTGKSSPSVQ